MLRRIRISAILFCSVYFAHFAAAIYDQNCATVIVRSRIAQLDSDDAPTIRRPQPPAENGALPGNPPNRTVILRRNSPPQAPNFEASIELGSGGVGTVTLEKPKGFKQLIAVKRVKNIKYIEDLKKEAQILKELSDAIKSKFGFLSRPPKRHTPEFYEYADEGSGQKAIRMEAIDGKVFGENHRRFFSGESFKTQLKSYLSQFQKSLEALQWVHSRGIVHGDLKESNMIEEKSGGIRLIDFGAAVHHKDSVAVEEVRGFTPEYAAPEVLGQYVKTHGHLPEGRSEYMGKPLAHTDEAIGTASDIYSMGLILRRYFEFQKSNLSSLTTAQKETFLKLEAMFIEPMTNLHVKDRPSSSELISKMSQYLAQLR